MLSRRRFIATLQSASVGLPLYAQLARHAIAEEPEQANILFNFFPGGITPELFFPAAGAIGQLPEMSAPLQPVAQYCTMIDGISLFAAPDIRETQAYILTGGGDTSLDNFIAADINRKRSAAAFSSLRLGVFSNQLAHYSNSVAGGQQLRHEDSPRLAYRTCFGEGPSREDALANSALKNVVGTDATQVIEQQLDGIANIASKIPPLNLRGLTEGRDFSSVTDANDIWTVVDIQQDIIAMALSCGLTQCVSFMIGHANWPVTPLDGYGRQTANYPTGDGAAVPYVQWYMERLRRLLLKLKALPGQQTASLLDETYVLTYSNTGIIESNYLDRMAFVLSGGHAFGHEGGYTLDYRQQNESGASDAREHPAELIGLPHTQLLTSVANALGLNIDSIGVDEARGGLGAGPLPNFWQRSAV
ncbi:MAG TPA: DUF1552 domain-containing protein [Marinagarivorans sp.]